jgi:hypothetical protein
LRLKGDSASEDEETGKPATWSGAKGPKRGSAPRSSDDGDRVAEGVEDLDLGPSIDLDPNIDLRLKAEVRWGDHLQTIRDTATFAEKPVHLRLDVTAYPEGIDRVVRVVVDKVTPGSSKSQAGPGKTLPPRPRRQDE